MAQMNVEEILMTYLPLEEDARELVDLYYRVSPPTFLEMGPKSAYPVYDLLLSIPTSHLGELNHRPSAGSPISSLRRGFKSNTSTQFTTLPPHHPLKASPSYSSS
jgi:hypothetical protein